MSRLLCNFDVTRIPSDAKSSRAVIFATQKVSLILKMVSERCRSRLIGCYATVQDCVQTRYIYDITEYMAKMLGVYERDLQSA